MDEVLPRWFFPVLNKIGLLPLVSREDVLKFSWTAALRGLVTATVGSVWCIYVALVWIYNVPNVNYVVKCWTAISASIYIGGAIIIVTNVIKCKCKAFDKIFENLAIFNRFWKTKMAAEPTFVNPSNVLLPYFLCAIRVLKCIYMIHSKAYDSYNFEIPLTFFEITHTLMTAALVTVMSKLAQNFRRLNKIVRYCPYPNSELGFRAHILAAEHSDAGGPDVTVAEIGDMHYLLCKTVAEINSFFGLQNAFLFTALSLNLVTRPFFSMKLIINIYDTGVDLNVLVVNVTEILLKGIQLFLIAYTANQLKRKGKRTGYHVSQLLSRKLTRDERKEVKYILKRICNCKAEIRVLNLFTVDMSVVTPILGLAWGGVLLQLQG